MKKTLLIVVMAVMFMVSEAQIQTPAASPAGSVSSTIGLTEVKIDYFRPRLKGRKIFGEKDVMYPYGTIWRTGANNGTKISFSDDVKVEGIDVPKGEYLIFTWPGANEWTVSSLRLRLIPGRNGGATRTAHEKLAAMRSCLRKGGTHTSTCATASIIYLTSSPTAKTRRKLFLFAPLSQWRVLI